MQEHLAELNASIDREFQDGVAEPKDPSGFLLKILNATQNINYSYDASKEQETKRELMRSSFLRIKSIAGDIAAEYRKVYTEKFGYRTGSIQIYVIGGRIKKDLGPGSDLDIVITVENSEEGLYLGSTRDQAKIKKYRAAEKRFDESLDERLRAYGFFGEARSDKTKTLWLDIHDRGISDRSAREEWLEDSKSPEGTRQAVLVYKG